MQDARDKRFKRDKKRQAANSDDDDEVLLDFMPHPKTRRILGPILQERFGRVSRGSASSVLDTAS